MTKQKYFAFICSMVWVLNAQTISFSVATEQGEAVRSCNVLFKEASESGSIKEFVTARQSEFDFTLKKSYQNLLIQIKAFGYEPQEYRIPNPDKNETYPLEFILKKSSVQLEEVTVARKRKFIETEDTVSYNVAAYTDGGERKIQEVIKKLPGVEVNEKSGEIKYKGKSVETVTLDGDNLFGYNYSLGTKNINVDMVEQIQAIDNYSENPLLKGIEQGGKVSLNLKLKKGKFDFSGDVETSTGLFNNGNFAGGLGATLLGITRTYKSFASITQNNFGINNSPFDYFGFETGVEEIKERNAYAKKIIPETQFSNVLEDDRININNQFFGNYNALFKLNKRVTVKTNLYYLRDRITSNQLFRNDFTINGEDFTTSDNTFITKKPRQYRGDVQVKYNTSKNSLLEYNLRLRYEDIETPTEIIQNGETNFTSLLQSRDFYLRQDLLYTQKLSSNKALQVSVLQSYNSVPQTYTLSPSATDGANTSDEQTSGFLKRFLEAKAVLLGSEKRNKYTFTVGANHQTTPFRSRLSTGSQVPSQNEFDYGLSTLFNAASYNLNYGRWRLSPSYNASIIYQNLEQAISDSQERTTDFVFEPSLDLRYTINSKSRIVGNASYKQNTNAEQYFFVNEILRNNRTRITNTPSLALQQKQRYSVFYLLNDLYNPFQFQVSSGYSLSQGNFFTNRSIDENLTQLQYFFLPQNQSSFDFGLNTSKYLSFAQTTIKLVSSYSLSNFRNIVNNSDLRSNQSQFFSQNVFLKTALDGKFNFQNDFTWQYSRSQSEGFNAFTNKSLQNSFRVIYRPNKRWYFTASADYYLPNTANREEDFMFVDFKARYRPKGKRWDASVHFRNIGNEQNFEQVQTSDISTNVFRTNLLPRYLTLNLAWSF